MLASVNFLRLFCLIFLSFLVAACDNQFETKSNKWTLVTQTTKDKYKALYLDENRISCENDKCRVWTKMEFGSVEAINYEAEKEGDQSGQMMTKRVDSSLELDCRGLTTMLISYNIMDKTGKILDHKWVKGDVEFAQKNTVSRDLLDHVCDKFNRVKK